MGTSSSYRSPPTPRWNAFNRALDAELPVQRIRAQLFLAGESEWQRALAEPAMSAYAAALLDAHTTLAERLEHAERPGPVIAQVVVEARSALFDDGYSPAATVGERALRAVLIAASQSEVPVADATGAQAAEAWRRNRGDPGRLLSRFLGTVFGEWAAHVAARDTARLVPERSSAQTRELARALSREVTELASSVPIASPSGRPGEQWSALVAAVFRKGRQLA